MNTPAWVPEGNTDLWTSSLRYLAGPSRITYQWTPFNLRQQPTDCPSSENHIGTNSLITK